MLWGGPNGLNIHISQTTYAKNLIQVPKDAEYVVSYLTSIHLKGLTGLDFKLTGKKMNIYQYLLGFIHQLSKCNVI